MGNFLKRICVAAIVGVGTYYVNTWLTTASPDFIRGLTMGSAIATFVWSCEEVKRA